MTARHPGFWVVAGWGLLNGVLAAVLALFRESLFAVALWVAVVVMLEAAAAAVLVSSRRGPDQHTDYRLPVGGGAAVLPAAAGVAVAALAFVYGAWLIALAVPLLAVAGALLVHGRAAGARGPR